MPIYRVGKKTDFNASAALPEHMEPATLNETVAHILSQYTTKTNSQAKPGLKDGIEGYGKLKEVHIFNNSSWGEDGGYWDKTILGLQMGIDNFVYYYFDAIGTGSLPPISEVPYNYTAQLQLGNAE